MRSLLAVPLTLLLLAHSAAPAAAQIVAVPRFALGSASAVTTPSVAVGADGTLVFIWSEAVSKDVRGAVTRPFHADGTPIGPAQRIDATNNVYDTGLAARDDGGFVATWHDTRPNGDSGAWARRLDALGAGVDAAYAVADASFAGAPARIAMLPTGPVFQWVQLSGLYYRLFTPQGFARDDRVRLDDGWVFYDVAARPDGGFVAVWWGFTFGRNLAQLFDGNGDPYGAPFLVSDEFFPMSVAVGPGGEFVVAGVGDPAAVWYRRFAPDGTAAGASIMVESGVDADSFKVDVSLDAQGNVYVASANFNSASGPRPPRARAFDATDQPLGPSFEIDPWPAYDVHVTRLPDDRLLNTWVGNSVAVANVVSLCTSGVAVCGDGVFHPQCEQCDDGAANSDTTPDACRSDCRRPTCGDGVIDGGETCDDGNRVSCDGCSAQCAIEAGLVCGDGIPNAACGQSCDDANTVAGDGCDASCALERIPGGGAPTTDCFVEWQVNNPSNVPLRDSQGAISRKQRCVDGDPACDFDGGVAGGCTFHVKVCANNTDLAACRPTKRLASWSLLKPTAAQAAKDPAAAAIRAAFAAVPGALVGPASNDLCTDDLAVRVPLKSGARPRAGKRALASASTLYDGRRDKDTLQLICLPAPQP